MPQVIQRLTSTGRVATLELPEADSFVLPGVKWGRYSEPFTPAFWRAYHWLHEESLSFDSPRPSKRDLRHEIALCLLGGYGIRAEVAYAYFEKLKKQGLLDVTTPRVATFRRALASPARHEGKIYRYRFPNQKARYLCAALRQVDVSRPPMEALPLRDWLLGLPGVGWKTAGWVVRNLCGADSVAIIDIHLHRIGRKMRLFDSRALGSATYRYFEERFLAFARALDVRASSLDLLMWETVRIGQRPLLRA